MSDTTAQQTDELPPCPGTGFYCRCERCTASAVFYAKLMRDIEAGAPFGKGESGC